MNLTKAVEISNFWCLIIDLMEFPKKLEIFPFILIASFIFQFPVFFGLFPVFFGLFPKAILVNLLPFS